MEGARWFAFAVRVGNNPDAIPLVVGTNGCRWNAFPFRIVPERGQLPENVSHPETEQAWRVFHDDEVRSKLANQSCHLEPEARASARETSSLPRC
jgi:hypothetical protein